MKRFFTICFCLLYLLSASGVLLHFHYCGGKIKSVSVIHDGENNCCCDKEKRNCCKEKEAYVKIEDNQSASSTLQVPDSKTTHLLFADASHLLTVLFQVTGRSCTSQLPSFQYKSPPYLKNRVLLI